MTVTRPPHYRVYRIVLAAVLVAALLAAVWWTAQPGVLRLIQGFLGLRVR